MVIGEKVVWIFNIDGDSVAVVFVSVRRFLYHALFFVNQSRLLQNVVAGFEKYVTNQQIQKLSGLFEGTCYLVLVSSVLVSVVQASIISFACLIAGYNDFLVIFMISFFMSFVPVVGSAPLSISMIAYSFFQGHVGAGIILLIAASIAAVSDNIIRTLILSQKEDSMHPIVSLLSLIGAMSLFGFLGLFLGPIVTELAFKISKIIGSTKNEDESLL